MSFRHSLQNALAGQNMMNNNNNNNNNNNINININNNDNNMVTNHNITITSNKMNKINVNSAALMTSPQSLSKHATPFTVSPPPNSTLDKIKRNWPSSKKQQLSQVFVKLKRSSIQESWGIIFSRFDNRLVLGDVKPKTQQHYTDWSVVMSGIDLVDPRDAFGLFQNSAVARETYRVRIKAYGHAMSLPTWQVCEQLLPGDLLVSVDGMDPMAFSSCSNFSSNMDGVTTYLRQALELSVVVLRHPQATAAAFACYNSHLLNQSALGLAAAADHVWKSFLVATPKPSYYATIPEPLIRRVTPDDQTLHQMGCSSPHDQTLHPVGCSSQPEQPSFSFSRPIAPVSSINTEAKQQQQQPFPNNPLETAIIETPVYHGWRNPWFQDDNGVPIPYEDNWEYSPEDGTRAHLFVRNVPDLRSWLQDRKTAWRINYKVYKVANKRWDNGDEEEDDEDPFDRSTSTVAFDFWTPQGFTSFEAWLQKRKEGWRTNYKVYRNKKRKIHQECEAVVHLSSGENFGQWLEVRKNQWKVHRRKRQRLRQIRNRDEEEVSSSNSSNHNSPLSFGNVKGSTLLQIAPIVTPEKVNVPKDAEIKVAAKRRRLFTAPPADIDMACIDDILEEEEARRKKLAERPPIDLSFLFDCNKSPDDVVIHILGFLDRKEHGKLLCVNKKYSNQLKARDELWRRLCPSQWILPRRPRKAWHKIYINRLWREEQDHQKRWDDLLLKCYGTICRGDQLNKIGKLVTKGEVDFGFHVNYVSPVVCERNCLLNLAVIHKRHKIVRWLLDQKGAHIESYDRGQFTPLLNAAWSGDKPMVRLLLERCANRSQIGFFHYSKPVSSPDFQGLTAEGWARQKGFDHIAKLIHLGL